MTVDDASMRIRYFHDASDEFLVRLGVDRALLPDPADWLEWYRTDFERPIPERQSYGVMWMVEADVVGWSNVDHIEFGRQAFMHLHIADEHNRATGHGSRFVALGLRELFNVLQLDRLYCEPNALNAAPNRTLQRVGFTYEFSHVATPGSINFKQVTTRWRIDRAAALG
ncbi:GNAT family N-acetyltransferase [Ilumatobacter sp.]|uniref:GNAT family N-acetyltransferase n=1 Tax=Ilumatobacter sp. TaxID=1967498 RepID=UPI003B52EC43